MAYTLDDFKHDTWRLLIDEVNDLSPEERQALLDRMDVDPAVASSIFVTMITDSMGFLAFLGLAAATGLVG